MTLTSANLANGGVTAHYRFQYDDSLSTPGGLEPARTNAVIAACEGDFNLMSAWFGNLALNANFPIPVSVTQNTGGASASWPSDNPRAISVTANPGSSAASFIRYLLVAEMVELFMRDQGRGWFGPTTEGTEGEGLSRFLSRQFMLVSGLGNPPDRFADSNKWLNSVRMDFVNSPPTSDNRADEMTGCATLFIWYLFSQLGFSVGSIVAAGATPLSAVYRKLTGDTTDPFLTFKALVDAILPGTQQITSGNLDNPFPARFDGILLRVKATGPVWVIYGNGRFQVPDAATQARLFPRARVFPFGDFLFAISTIPDDGTLLREETSSQVWLIQNRVRVLAPPGAPGTVHVLWQGALRQIPLPRGILAGVVSDTQSAPLSDASVLITATFPIPSAGGNTEQLSTDAQGRYGSSFLPAGVYSVEASRDGFVPFTTNVTILDGVQVTTLNFRLARTLPFTISGNVTDTMGAAVAATVRLTENSAIPGIITVQTDPTGHYSIIMDPGPYNGDYTIDVTATGFGPDSRTITIPNGAMITLNFTLARQGTVLGHVRDSQSQPLGGATVTVGSSATSTDVTGAYNINVNPGTYNVTASDRGYTPVSASVSIPSGVSVVQNFDLSRTITGSVTGTVVDDTLGGPRGGARVAALGETLATTDDDGRYTLADLQPGPTPVTASAGPRYSQDTETVVVISGQTVTQDFVVVRKGTRV
jgi:hypothetical protein